MKKLLLFCLIAASTFSFADLANDLYNANYLASKNIIEQQFLIANYRLDDNITRAEVVGIALKIYDIKLPESYSCK